jgi:release factor glutamine methyltransferase
LSDIGQAVAEVAGRLAGAGIGEARREARLLLAAATGLPDATIVGYPERSLSGAECRRLASLAERRAAREPISRILGWREFWSLRFAIGPDTLDPRPESETLVEAALDFADPAKPLSVLDLGTGSGCLLLAVLSELPFAQGLGIDINPGALAVAAANARSLGLDDRASFRRGDWGEGTAGRFEVILCNPPYIPAGMIAALQPEVAIFDPPLALSGGPDGLAAYRALAACLPRLLAAGGRALVEVGAGQADEVVPVLASGGLRALARRSDLAGTVRCLAFGGMDAR